MVPDKAVNWGALAAAGPMSNYSPNSTGRSIVRKAHFRGLLVVRTPSTHVESRQDRLPKPQESPAALSWFGDIPPAPLAIEIPRK